MGTGLENYIKTANTNVKHIPSANRKEIVDLMNHHHAFLSLSRTETFGMAITESLATGMPAVITKSGGPESYFSKEYGFLTSIDLNEILLGIDNLEENFEVFDSSKISSSILSKFGAANYVAQIEQIIQLCELQKLFLHGVAMQIDQL